MIKLLPTDQGALGSISGSDVGYFSGIRLVYGLSGLNVSVSFVNVLSSLSSEKPPVLC